MSTFVRDTAHTTATDLARDLTKVGITLPTEITDAIQAVQTHLDRPRPPFVTAAALADAYAAGATDEQIHTLTIQNVTHPAQSAAFSEASKQLGVTALRTFTANGDDLTRQLADKAAPLIATLTDVAALPTTDVAALIRTGNNAGADLAAHADVTAGDLAFLYKLRRGVTRHAEYGQGGWDPSIWRNARAVREAEASGRMRATMTTTERYLTGIQIGGDLWFPTPAESVAVAAQLIAEDKQADLDARIEDRRSGRNRATFAA